MATIPEVRGKLLRLAQALSMMPSLHCQEIAVELMECHRELFRRPPVRKAPRKQTAPTQAQIEQVRLLAELTDLSQLEIGNRVGVNPGRVSEILHGVRD